MELLVLDHARLSAVAMARLLKLISARGSND